MYKKRESRDRSRSCSRHFQQFSSLAKKGQVTIFIIVGILLLLGVVLVILIKKEVVQLTPEELSLPEEGRVEDIVRNCVYRLGNEALFTLGLQGGYIDVPSELSYDGSTHLRLSPVHVIPYWAVGMDVRIPSPQEIEQRLNEYLQKNLQSCVFSQESYLQTYDLIEKSDPDVKTTLAEKTVLFSVRWEIEVRTKAGERVAELFQHDVAVPVRLKALYETARKIVEREMTDFKLEDLTQDLIALEHPNLPLSGIELSCSQKKWDPRKAKKVLQDLLRINLKQLRISGTEFEEFPEELQYYQKFYIWNFGETFLKPEVTAVFNYENSFPMTFQVTPLEGGKMVSGVLSGSPAGGRESFGLKDLLPNFCVQNWKFTYDVAYPVLVQITDQKNDYLFQMAFTVHLIRNVPNRAAPVFARTSAPLVGVNNEEYCSEVKIPMSVLTWELVENDQGVFDQQPLEGVDLTFTCLKFACPMEKTKFNYQETGFQASAHLNFPYCPGGILRGKKEGYIEAWERVVTENGKQVELFLLPLHKIPTSQLKVLTHAFQGVGQLPAAGIPLQSKETALVKLRALKQGKEIHKTEQVLSKDMNLASLQSLQLLAKADFSYELELQVFDEENLLGGYKANWTAPWGALESAQEITFHALVGKNQDEVFEVVLGLPQYSALVPPPEIK